MKVNQVNILEGLTSSLNSLNFQASYVSEHLRMGKTVQNKIHLNIFQPFDNI